MTVWLPTLLNCLAILVTIVLTHSLILYSQFHSKAEGYMWRAARKIWFYLLMLFGVEWIISAFFFYLSKSLPAYVSVPLWLFAGIIGIIAAAIPTSLEKIFLPGANTTVETLERPLTRFLLKLKLDLRHNFAWAVESCRQQDVFDCQKPNSWGLNLDPRTVGRRIRMVYEFCKVEIAEKRKDPSFLRYDLGYTPWIKFYLLSKHLGRKRLRESIITPVNWHCPGWDGSERRITGVGTRGGRTAPEDVDNPRCRVGDDPALIKRIRSGNDTSDAPELGEAD